MVYALDNIPTRRSVSTDIPRDKLELRSQLYARKSVPKVNWSVNQELN